MSMMSEIHAAMTESGEVARVEKLEARATELDAEIAAAYDAGDDLGWIVALKRARRLALQEIDRITGIYALRIAGA